MKTIRYLIAAIALLLIIPACGTADSTCETDSDCTSPQKCLWVVRGGQVVGKSCVTRCGADPECGGNKTCTGTARSCPACGDNSRICEL